MFCFHFTIPHSFFKVENETRKRRTEHHAETVKINCESILYLW